MCALVTQWPEQVHDVANKRVLGVFTLNCLQTGHWVRVDYYIMMDWAHVLVIVQCQTDGCSLSCKDGAVVWQSFGQLAAGCLTILEMAVDDCRCPHSLVYFGAISVNFIMWSLCFMKLIELSLGFLSRDHAFTYSFNEVVSLGIVIIYWIPEKKKQDHTFPTFKDVFNARNLDIQRIRVKVKLLTSLCGPRALWYSWNLARASSLVIIDLLTPSMRPCLSGSYSCVPGGKLGIFKGQTISASISAKVRAYSTLRPTGWVGGRVMPPFPFGLERYRSVVVGSNSCRVWCAGLSVQARVFK